MKIQKEEIISKIYLIQDNLYFHSPHECKEAVGELMSIIFDLLEYIEKIK